MSSTVEANRQNFNNDWRTEKPNFVEQMAHFCMKEEMADVEFVFNRENGLTVFFSQYFIRVKVESLVALSQLIIRQTPR